MNDTSPWAERKMDELMARRTGGERVAMAARMFETARALMASNIRGNEPGISDIELRARIFERTYGDDFTPERMASILAALRAHWSRT